MVRMSTKILYENLKVRDHLETTGHTEGYSY